MNSVSRILTGLVGVVLFLPGGCSLAFTPMLIFSAFGRDLMGLGDPKGLFAATLYFVPLGFVVALGGGWLLQCALRGDTAVPVSRWRLTTAGLLLLLPAVAATLLWRWGFLPRMSGPTNPQAGLNLAILIFAPVWLALGAYFLWRAKNARP